MVKATLPEADPTKPMGLAYMLGRLDHVLNKRLRECCAPAGLTVPQYTALSVFRAQGALSNAQLATRTMMAPQSANEMVKVMEAKGWIERTPDPAHGRIIQIQLTKQGDAILSECDGKVRAVEQQMFPDLTEAELQQLFTRLRGAVRALTLEGI
ncbi:MarR family transcriptional regulator [Duganella sp. FT80W]|uniref:MarR family transcriptional regulator n=1 Tax=Duganella guangzhouensis TaxID=2666084 RepID=A0A6I2KZ12_9BURK|nr:MarR family winged helix-turn-helix transcriptional regulator [Duganella guangzhouensis]MRW91061.1 MarR family transcriptional regulator [Duganella guangzhouensis]